MSTYEHMVLPLQPQQRVSRHGLKSLLTWLEFSGFATQAERTEDESWTRVMLRPGPYAHNLFIEGEARTPGPAFTEMEIAFGDTPKAISWGEEAVAVYVYIRFFDVPFGRLLELLEERLVSIMALRTKVHTRLRS